MKKHFFILSMISLFTIGCSNNDDNDKETVPEAEDTFTTEQLSDAANYSKEKGGSAVLVMTDGSVIFEDYHNGADQDTAPHIYSATKLYWSAVAALAKQQGLIDYEEYVSNTITEWQDTGLHPGKNKIKIKHLLTLSSGLSQNFLTLSDESDRYQYAIDELKMVSTPGEKFSYGPSNYYIFGVLLERKLQEKGISQNPLEYLESEIFDKIGLEYDSWSYDEAGNPNIPNGCHLTPRNWVKFGQFMIDKGNYNGTQIIETSLLENMFLATGPNPGHGNFCWLNNVNGYGLNPLDAAPDGSSGGIMYYHGYTEIIGGLGSGKNRMYLIPSLKTVIIRQTTLDEDTFEDHEFLEFLLN
ncbi:serine hydrolase domain-containing protein [Zobellia galactanivorans]|uniref:serine hydrolase domain-containing protein n=1 Tax=Zobellia galactanivorans (strain DSM 12802 / CCUG 47099 / CIP 106680 / NCIMB 13871 / Dsij) TaxID=63186 RepID=UPI0026E12C02|nr:serine hydrolase domain-containing protein [Zobellia galactanivorans]MDO6810663.1 serine hydrolase domain-containing protein [Zobellia galactanivorans]